MIWSHTRALNKHMKEVHSGTTFSCRNCPRTYKTKSNKVKHEKTCVHSSPRYEPRSPSHEPPSPSHRPGEESIEEFDLSQELSREDEMSVSSKDGEEPAAVSTEERDMDTPGTANLNACSCHGDDWRTCGARRPPAEQYGSSTYPPGGSEILSARFPASRPGSSRLGPRSPPDRPYPLPPAEQSDSSSTGPPGGLEILSVRSPAYKHGSPQLGPRSPPCRPHTPQFASQSPPPDPKADVKTKRVEVRLKKLSYKVLQEENMHFRLSRRTEAVHEDRPLPPPCAPGEEDKGDIVTAAGRRDLRREDADPSLQQPNRLAVEEILGEVLARMDKAAKEAHDLNHALAQEIIDRLSADG